MAFWTLFWAPWIRFTAADNFIDTANPPGSSTGEVSFLPLAKRSNDFCKLALFDDRYAPAYVRPPCLLIYLVTFFYLLCFVSQRPPCRWERSRDLGMRERFLLFRLLRVLEFESGESVDLFSSNL